ncbi:MAG TPA: HD domain-containing phosphohydrolase [Terriglobia bacterium]|nr:HD domain-containing phosphohydrolase [Terriglobia bacterium]
MATGYPADLSYGRSSYDELLEVLGLALDFRDNDTAGHSRRVARYTLEIAKALGCSSEQVVDINRGAYLHDLGKIAIPDAVLLKKGKLTPAEWEVMKTHAWIGHNLLTRISLLAPVAQILLTHHERFDGTGYPRGLKGNQIPLGARIFAVADTLDAMISDRPYRKGLSYSQARDEIARQSGRQFDPIVVEAFLAIPEETIRGMILAEKRRTLRLDMVSDVICRNGAVHRKLKSLNICEGGMLLEHAEGIEVGAELTILFQLPESSLPLELKATAVRRDLPDRLAVAFKDISIPYHDAIRSYITARVQA